MGKHEHIHVSLVSYLNSYPFHYGLLNSDIEAIANPEIVPPAKCAENFKTGKSNIALVPVGALPELKSYRIIEPFCIAASGIVKSVFLQSHSPLQKIQKIALDPDSRSSNLLTKILCEHSWQISPEFTHIENEADARVIIGDRALQSSENYPYRFDLAEEWTIKFGLPFVFAVWITAENIDNEAISEFNKALEFGISNIEKAVDKFGTANISREDAIDYLNDNIVFRMDSDAKEAMNLFLRLAKITG
ncbi:MAG: radical SAM protein [Marinilabiliales bacterium]|nr:MAG: radical SAM protein [Marinilabiliales bacterium]